MVSSFLSFFPSFFFFPLTIQRLGIIRIRVLGVLDLLEGGPTTRRGAVTTEGWGRCKLGLPGPKNPSYYPNSILARSLPPV